MSKKRKHDPGPNPDPRRLVLVRSKEGDYYRHKRGLLSPAPLNATLKKSAENTRVASPAAKRILQKLGDHLEGLKTGRTQVRFCGMLRKALHRKGRADYSNFAGYDLQDDHPLTELLEAPYQTKVHEGSLTLSIPLDKRAVRRHNTLVTHYFFDAVLLWGDPTKEDGLRVDSVTSSLYPIGPARKSTCTLSLELPKKGLPWMALLKVSCLEGNELAVHPKHYGMRIVKVG